MVWGLAVVLAFGQVGSKADISRALALWNEFGRPLAVDERFWDANPDYRFTHFEESRVLSVALASAEKGNLKQLEDFGESLTKGERTWDMNDEEWLGAPQEQNIEGRTAMLIYKHGVNQFLDGRPTIEVLDQLKALLKKKLIGKRWKFSRNLDDFVAELSETVKTSGKPPGTLEYAIDRLSEMTDADNRNNWQPPTPWHPKEYKAIEAFGLDAIPALVEMLGTKKLARSFEIGRMNKRSQVTHVDMIVRDLIFRMADGELASSSADKEVVLGWLDAKRKGKVKDWIVSRLFVKPKNYHAYGNPSAFISLGKKYPYLIKWSLEESIRRKIELGFVVYALEESNLGLESKFEILDRMLTLDYAQGYPALEAARKLDQSRYDRAVFRYIDLIPSKFSKKEYSEVRYALGTRNPEVWKLVRAKIDHGDTLMRMTLLSKFGYGDGWGNKQADLAILLLSEYFDSTEVVPHGTDMKAFMEADSVPWEPGLTVGQVALETASTKMGNHVKLDIPRKDKAGWQKVRKEIEDKYKLSPRVSNW